MYVYEYKIYQLTLSKIYYFHLYTAVINLRIKVVLFARSLASSQNAIDIFTINIHLLCDAIFTATHFSLDLAQAENSSSCIIY